MRGLDGKVAIVTGSASGIGAETARRLAAEGARVVVADIAADGAEAVADEIRRSGGEAFAYVLDVSEEDRMASLMAETARRYGGIDVVHNNAVANTEVLAEGAVGVAKVTVDVWDRTLAVNLRGYLLGCKHSIPYMVERGGGSIVNTSSVVSYAPLPVQPAYASSKGGINALTKSVATSYGHQGIRCNAVCPGFIVTPSTEGNYSDEFVEMTLRHTPARRLGRPEDIAALVAFLASDDASFITGQIIAVDGGLTTPLPFYGPLGPPADDV